MTASTSYAQGQAVALAEGVARGLVDIFGAEATLRDYVTESSRLQTDKGFIVRIPYASAISG